MNYSLLNGSLFVNNTHVEFKYLVVNVLSINQTIIVLLDSQEIEIYNENIFGVNENGQIIWQVQERPNLNSGGYNQPFMNIWITDDGKLMCGDLIGVDFWIDPSNGLLTYAGVSK